MRVDGAEELRGFSRWSWVLWVGLLLISFGIRIYRLDGQSLWRDEGLTVARAHQPVSLILKNRNVVQGVSLPDLHPPLYFLFMKGWCAVAGQSELALRFPSLFASVLTVAMLGALGRRIWHRESGVWAALPAAFAPFNVWYAQEARMYSAVALESALLLYALLPLLQRRVRWVQYIPFALAAIVLVYTHYSGAALVGFALCACFFVWAQKHRWRAFLLAVLVALVSALIALPLFPNLRTLLTVPGFIAFHRGTPWSLLRNAANTFSLGSAGRMAGAGWRLTPFVALVAVGSLNMDVVPRSRRWQTFLVSVGGFLVTLGLFYLASWLQENYSNPRHLTVLSPLWFLLMGHGLSTLRRRLWPLAALAAGIALVLQGIALYQMVSAPPIAKDDVRGLAEYVAERARPGDAILWHNAIMMMTYDYYALDLPYTALPQYGKPYARPSALQDVEDWVRPYRRIWFVIDPKPTSMESPLPDWFASHMVRVKIADFPASWTALNLHLYSHPRSPSALPANALRADLQEGAYSIGYVVPEPDAVAGKGMWISVFWKTEGKEVVNRPSLCVQLRNSRSKVVSQGCAKPFMPSGQQPVTETWMEQQVWLPLHVGMAPVSYKMEVKLGDTRQTVGDIQVRRARDAATDPKPLAQFTGGLDLVGVEWDDEGFRAGLWAVGDLVWRVEAAPGRDLGATVRLVDALGRSVVEQALSLGPTDYSAQDWQAGELVRDFVAIQLPFQLRGPYRVQLSVTEADGRPLLARGRIASRTWANLGWVRVVSWPMERTLPDHVSHRPKSVLLGDSIRLEGYDLRREGDTLQVVLYWRSKRRLTVDYGVFVHVGLPGEPPLAQNDGGPANWTRPVSTWRRGEVIEDVRQVSLPSDLRAGDASILVGMYDLDRPQLRLPLSVQGEDVPDGAFLLGELP